MGLRTGRDRFLSVFTLVSRIPVRASFGFDLSRIDFWLPVCGVFPALIAGLVVFLFRFLPSSGTEVAAVVILAAQYSCFNLFHLDGLMDSADAFLGTVDAEKRIAILKDSRIGVYGFFAGFFSLLFKFCLLSNLLSAHLLSAKTAGAFVLFSWPITGRTAAVLVPVLSPPASGTGLGSRARDARLWRVLAGFLAAALLWFLISAAGALLPAALSGRGLSPAQFLRPFAEDPGLLPLSLLPFAAALAALPVAGAYRRGIGGYTGDALGAAVELGELAHLFFVYIMVNIGLYAK